jgi:hypothetical protein
MRIKKTIFEEERGKVKRTHAPFFTGIGSNSNMYPLLANTAEMATSFPSQYLFSLGYVWRQNII